MPSRPAPAAHRISRPGGSLHALESPGDEPALVMMHGFPDNLHIYDRLTPHLAGRRTVVFDFLGYGESDKPAQHPYTSRDQQEDLRAVLDGLALDGVLLVAHDASGPVALNFTLGQPGRVAGVALLNTYYAPFPGLRLPDFIEVFARPELSVLAAAFAASPEQFAWIMGVQARAFGLSLDDPQGLGQAAIVPQITRTPSALPAFLGQTRDLYPTLAANAARLPAVRTLEVPARVIFGRHDPYLSPAVARNLQGNLAGSELHLLDAGHWPQWDRPEEVARLLLAPLVQH